MAPLTSAADSAGSRTRWPMTLGLLCAARLGQFVEQDMRKRIVGAG